MKEIKISELTMNPFELINNAYLVGAQSERGFNAMSASWGSLGHLWNKDVVSVYVRPQRYTESFMNESDYFTLSFLDKSQKAAIALYGTKSGRDINKEEASGLHLEKDEYSTYIAESTMVIVCKKLYKGKFTAEEVIDESVLDHYPEHDFHNVYIGEIVKVLVSE